MTHQPGVCVPLRALFLVDIIASHLRNKFNFWSVHGIMNTSGLVKPFSQ